MKHTVCIDAVYYGRDFLESVREAAALGAKDIEFWSWWDKDIDALCALQEELKFRVVTFCTPFVSLVAPAQREEYLDALARTLEVAQRLHCKKIISQVGADTGRPREEQHASLLAGLKAGASMLEQYGVTLLVEPLNLRVDHPGYYLSASEEAFALIEEVGSEKVKVLFDIYHQQINEGDILRRAIPNLSKIGHFHAAGSFGRHELDNGELNYPFVFAKLDEAGYQEYTGLEYFPLKTPEQGIRAFIHS